jgi:hypothetical protein
MRLFCYIKDIIINRKAAGKLYSENDSRALKAQSHSYDVLAGNEGKKGR